MSDQPNEQQSGQVHTIGHSDLPIDVFVERLLAHGVDTVVDVRSRPQSRFPWFNRDALAQRLAASDVAYLFLGDALGGLPADIRMYSMDGAPDYYQIARQPFYAEALERVLALVREKRHVALMCGEADPMVCHREQLVGQSLRAHGVEVEHILKPEAAQVV